MELARFNAHKVTILVLCLTVGQFAMAAKYVKVKCVENSGKVETSYFQYTKAGVGASGTVFVTGKRLWIADTQPTYEGCTVCEEAMIHEEKMDFYNLKPCEQKIFNVRIYKQPEVLTCAAGSSLEYTDKYQGKPIRLGTFNACDNYQSYVRLGE